MSRETLKNFLNLKGFGTDSISPGYDKEGPASREESHDLGKDLNAIEKNFFDQAKLLKNGIDFFWWQP